MYSLVWTERAYDDLADVWVLCDPATRDRIEAAINRLNAELRADPWNVGEERELDGERRIGFISPVAVTFRINEAARTVRVDHIWRYGR